MTSSLLYNSPPESSSLETTFVGIFCVTVKFIIERVAVNYLKRFLHFAMVKDAVAPLN